MDQTWKKLFLLLFNNQLPDIDLPRMWAQFKKEHLNRSDIEKAILSVQDHVRESEREKLAKICSDESANFLDSAELEDNTWRLLFTSIRDREPCPISRDTKVPIVQDGQTRLMSIQEIEEKFCSENPDILKSQTSVPDQIIHDDLIDPQFNITSVRNLLKQLRENKRSCLQTTMVKENPKWKTTEVEKQAAAQAKRETKNSKEAQFLKRRVAMMAKHKVQRSIERVMKEYDIPALVLRGVSTYSDIAKELGIKVSRLRAFNCNCRKNKLTCTCTLECEHDIVTIALLPAGPLLCFNQVQNKI